MTLVWHVGLALLPRSDLGYLKPGVRHLSSEMRLSCLKGCKIIHTDRRETEKRIFVFAWQVPHYELVGIPNRSVIGGYRIDRKIAFKHASRCAKMPNCSLDIGLPHQGEG